MMTRTVWLIAIAARLAAQPLSLNPGTLHGRPAWVIENGTLRVSALSGGGHLGEIRFATGDSSRTINPMRVPHYPTIDPHTFDPAKHEAFYGNASHRWLSAGYMGHLVCFPSYGPPSSENEVRNLLGNHGEAPIAEWKLMKMEKARGSVTLRYGADLARTQYRIERAITLRAGEPVVYVEEWVENLANYDRPFNWMQHATFGPPFVEPGKTYYDVSGTRGEVRAGPAQGSSLKPGSHVEFPKGTGVGGRPVDLRAMQTVPAAGAYYVVRTNADRPWAWFTLYHSAYPLLVGYVFSSADHPWIADWQENKRNTIKPWNGQVIARGIEFGTSPFDEGLRKSVERGTHYGTPTYRWIAGKEKIKTSWNVFLAEIPQGFAGVQDLRVESGRITLVERSGGRIRTIPASGLP